MVSNAAGTLWNLSARSATDQAALVRLGAVSVLRSLALSRHRAIATCAAAALRNLHSGAAAQLAQDQLLAEPGLLAGRRTRTLVENIQARAAND